MSVGPAGGRQAHPEFWEESGGPLKGLGGVGRSTQRSEMGREVHPEVREGSGVPLRIPGGVGRPTRRSGRVGKFSRRLRWVRRPTQRTGRCW